MLNGHCVSDGLGLLTCHHSDMWSTMDYTLVPRAVCSEMVVLDVPGGGSDHWALLAMLRAHCPVVAAAVAGQMDRAAVVRLAPVEASAF